MTRSRSLFRTRTAVTGAVDLRRGIEAFGDARLAGQLGAGLGLQPADQAALRKALRFEIGLRVPGGHKTWQPRIGSRTPVQLSATAWNTDVLFPALVAIVTALVSFALAPLQLHALGTRRREQLSDDRSQAPRGAGGGTARKPRRASDRVAAGSGVRRCCSYRTEQNRAARFDRGSTIPSPAQGLSEGVRTMRPWPRYGRFIGAVSAAPRPRAGRASARRAVSGTPWWRRQMRRPLPIGCRPAH